jgi:Ca2+-transporting ATPase
MRTTEELASQLPVSAETGLPDEAVARSRELFGRNDLTPPRSEPAWRKLLDKFDDPIITILMAAALLSTAVEVFAPPVEVGRYAAAGSLLAATAFGYAATRLRGLRGWGPVVLFVGAAVLWPVGAATGHGSWDGLAVMVAVALATGVAFLAEYSSDRAFEALNARRDEFRAKVVRCGAVRAIPVGEVVVGDTVLLEVGDEIPADGFLVQGAEVSIDQSLLTGESLPVRKSPLPAGVCPAPDRSEAVFRGTHVIDGLGRMVVTAVGGETELGRIAAHLRPEGEGAETDRRVRRRLLLPRELTPLQERLGRLAGQISRVGYAAAVAIFLALVIRGLLDGELRWPGGEDPWAAAVHDGAVLLRYFLYMVVVIVVAVPEGLPMSVTISLALAMRKMTRANSLVRQLAACETIGSATVICTDKTGTLTQNKMRVERVAVDGRSADRGGPNWPDAHREPPDHRGGRPLDWLALIGAADSTAELEGTDGAAKVIGNPTEGAVLLWLRELGVDYRRVRMEFAPCDLFHFSSERKRMTAVVARGGRLVALVKGAPEWVLDHSTRYVTADGTVRAVSPAYRDAVRALHSAAAARSLRLLAFAYAPLPAGGDANRGEVDRDLVYVGFVGIRDPLRGDVRGALAECRAAGITVLMLTGDNPETARVVAEEAGLLDTPDALVLTSDEMADLTDEELTARLPQLRVLARAKPLDKLRLVRLLRDQGEVVAVTGDGTNDAPALRRADVGLAMGAAGTEVAKEASKIVLLDDSFATIVNAVHWGRALYENIQKFIQFQLTINASALVIAFLGPFFGLKPPFTVLQLLWINVIMDTLAAIALCSDPPRTGLMRVPPKRQSEGVLTRDMLVTVTATAGFYVVVMMGLLAAMHGGAFAGTGERSIDFPALTYRQVTIFFTVYVFFQLWNEVNCRSLSPSVSGFRGIGRNPTFLAVVGLIAAAQVLIVTFGGRVFQVELLTLRDWLVIVASTASVAVFAELLRHLRSAQVAG